MIADFCNSKQCLAVSRLQSKAISAAAVSVGPNSTSQLQCSSLKKMCTVMDAMVACEGGKYH